MTLSRILLLLAILFALFQFTYYEPRLPGTMATHFGKDGQANGWSPKETFLLVNLAVMAGMALLFGGLGGLVRRVPDSWVSLPYKDYWLAPERRAATMAAIQRQMEWMGVLVLAMFLGATQFTIEANLVDPPVMGEGFGVMFGGYMLLVVVWLAVLIRQSFRKPPVRDVGA